MFKFVAKTVVLGAIGVGALGLLYGKDQVMAWARQGKAKIETQITEFQGMNSELRSIQGRVSSLESEIHRLKESAIREDVEVQHLEKETTERQGSLDRLKSNLEKARSLLTGTGERYRIGGVEYDRGEIERDVAEKIELYKVQQETLAQLKQTLETHRSALAIARENVTRGESLRGELGGKVRLLQAKLEKHRAREIYAEAVANDFDSQEFNTSIGELRRAFSQFETKLEVKNRMLDQRMKVAQGSHVAGIDYDAPDRAKPENVLERLSAVLHPAPAAPAAVVIVTQR